MKCMHCGRLAYLSKNTEAIELGDGRLLVIRNIPCYKCRECDDIFYTGDIVEQLEKITENARANQGILTVVEYTDAA